MNISLIKVALRYEHDIVLARQRARTIAGLLGFNSTEQTRIGTAVSEIARNAFQYAGGGEVDFLVGGSDRPQRFMVRVSDRGGGLEELDAILEGRYISKTGMGLGIIGTRRLMDYFHIDSTPGTGTTVLLGKEIPSSAAVVTPQVLDRIAEEINRHTSQNPFEEIQQQNQELLVAMNELHQRKADLEAMNRELEDTNRGIVALYSELDEKAEHLNQANELKVRFLSDMSHEFRTPLSSILSLAKILSDRIDGDLSSEQEKQVRYIHKSAEDLLVLVNNLLDIAKIEAGKTEVHPEKFEIGNTFSTLRGMLKPLLVNPAVKFEFGETDGFPSMLTDEGKLAQILRNLISNAIKFTEFGEIRVEAETDPDSSEITFSITDTGIGIPPGDLDRIFEEYTQVDMPLHNKIKGTGLGLSLAKKLAELLGGRLTVESILGVGSTFTVSIPICYVSSAETVPKSMLPLPDVTRLPALVVEKILVIDDEEVGRYIMKGLLTDTKYRILEAAGGVEGLKTAAEQQPDIIFLDLMMPEMDGVETLMRLKADSSTCDIPVIILTSKVLDDAEQTALRKSALAVLSKESITREVVLVNIRDAVVRFAKPKI
ncbi:response regulator [Desulforhopalus vacuolatus]|uniref:ATP-binding protein n=1 Tax=Desulforhopalus vacuolatus TaxID=40414 RepID=UPI001962D66F|nr:ATP-binding protein [Desulforhopalus vacuolatus]MBM9518526.1 response regulator [Desulforhopalus vacuolatus]